MIRECMLILLFSSAAIGGLGMPQQVALGPTAPCGALTRWKMPPTTQVNATAEESRQYDILVTQARIDAIILAAEGYCRLNGNVYPATFEQMIAPPEAIARAMPRCRLDPRNTVDYWDRPIFYTVVQDSIIVRSAGSDGRFTTPDDIGRPAPSDPHVEVFDVDRECRSN